MVCFFSGNWEIRDNHSVLGDYLQERCRTAASFRLYGAVGAVMNSLWNICDVKNIVDQMLSELVMLQIKKKRR